ncbi:pseudouridine synthase [Vibrio sp. AK197]
MPHQDPRFHSFASDIRSIELPSQFTFPFYYQPHSLCKLAASQLQQHLLTQTEWRHDFGIEGQSQSREKTDAVGKMFGVLVVQSPEGEIGYLAGFSGKIAEQNLLPGFVPPVFDMLAKDSFFHAELAQITELNSHVTTLSHDDEFIRLQQQLAQLESDYQQHEAQQRQHMIAARAERKQQRINAEQTLEGDALKHALDALAKASVADKNTLKYLKLEWEEKIAQVNQHVARIQRKLEQLKTKRKQLSHQLQKKLFDQYQFLNQRGEQLGLNQIFQQTGLEVPPAGAGECAAPKLLQYAYLHGYHPLAMAEFWWGVSPKSEIRKHGQFYPSCHSKCQPILTHMLKGLEVEPNPLEQNWAEDKPLTIVYQDEAMVVVNKPSGLLSVPGKTIKDSAYTRLQQQFPDVEGPFVIHRLDMATSGLLVFALTKRANKSLQKQFISREVKKRYVALLCGEVPAPQGQIDLPMRGDPDDRPRQLVCFEHGKPARTEWQEIVTTHGQSKVYLYPHTGRTHQLRVHCAHHLGLNLAMVGDGLYGTRADRLHLHAETLEFAHPYTKQPMVFQADAEF